MDTILPQAGRIFFVPAPGFRATGMETEWAGACPA